MGYGDKNRLFLADHSATTRIFETITDSLIFIMEKYPKVKLFLAARWTRKIN